jgi:hypothetical protein
MLPLTFKEKAFLKKLSTPAKVQDFINSIPFNFEKNKIDTLKSPVRVLRENNAHCFEGAILAAYILSLHGHKPLVMYLQSTKKDFDHVVAPFKQHGCWGAISKTNHGVLRYREPMYKTIRELAASYFHEYFLDTGEKTLRRYTEPLDLNAFDDNWMFEEGDLWGIDQALDKARHHDLISKEAVKTLRKADPVERQAGKLTEWK